MPGARSTCPAPAGSASTPHRACWPAKATSRWRARRSRRARRRSAARSTSARSSSRTRCASRASGSRRASPSRTPMRSGPRCWRWARASTKSWWPATCGSRWAASPPSCRWTTAMAPSGTPMRSGPPSASTRKTWCKRLRDRYGRGGFLHFGQGKWYPGEQLPRWALSVYWRADGQPCWRDPSLFADEREAHGYTSADAKRFIDALTRRLGLTGDHIQTGYEDTWYYLWRERKLPVNVDPFDARLDDELERIRLRRVFEQGLSHPIGYALPLKRDDGPGLAGPRWVTGPWFFRDERMYLMPGDSPMGYRLPLDSLPWVTEGDYPYQSSSTRSRRAAPCRPRRRCASSTRRTRWVPCASKAMGERQRTPLSAARLRRADATDAAGAAATAPRSMVGAGATGSPMTGRRPCALAETLRVGALDRANGADRRGPRSAARQRPEGRGAGPAQRCALCLHAAVERTRALPRAARRGRSHRGRPRREDRARRAIRRRATRA